MFRSFTVIITCALSIQTIAQTTLPDRMYADSTYAPYMWGVASGDPTSDGVVIWTKIQESLISVIQPQTWEVSLDSSFAITSATGSVDALANNDFCVRAVATGLQPDAYYYYRFTDSISGNTSRIGRTKTAPEGATDNITFAVASCSSIYSGYFNAYRNIGNNDEVDVMIHLGDYIYNFVDDDEQIRVPEPFPADPGSLEEWRDRHEYYLLDPDLRKARQMHPWVVIWDNHDFGNGTEGGIEAFWEYVPRRDSQNDTSLINRSLAFGDLVDLIMIDIEKYRNIDAIIPGEPSVLGNEQRNWFLNELSNSNAKWRVVGNQKMFGGWYSEGIPPWLGIPNDGEVFDDGSWDGFMTERDTVLHHIIDNNINNFMMISGDVHMSFCMDVSLDPRDSLVYDPISGNGSIAVEFIPSSISRGNFDENGIDQSFQNVIETASGNLNPHHMYTNFYDHGYGILEINHDSIMAEIRFCDKLTVTNDETLGTRMVMLDGANKWKRTGNPASVSEVSMTNHISVYPNPSSDVVTISIDQPNDPSSILTILNSAGRVVKEVQPTSGKTELDLKDLPNGNYIVKLTSKNGNAIKSFIIAR